MSSTRNAAVFLGRDFSNNLHSIRNTDERPTVKKLFEYSKIGSGTKIKNLRVVRNKLGNFYMEKIVPGERRRNNQSLENKILCILRFCVVSWESSSVL